MFYPRYIAAYDGNLSVVQHLLRFQAAADKATEDGRTPLIIAAGDPERKALGWGKPDRIPYGGWLLRNPKHQLKVRWFLHPMILLGLNNHPFGDAGFRNHPQYVRENTRKNVGKMIDRMHNRCQRECQNRCQIECKNIYNYISTYICRLYFQMVWQKLCQKLCQNSVLGWGPLGESICFWPTKN